MDNQDEVPYLEVKMPERFLLQFRLDDKREIGRPPVCCIGIAIPLGERKAE